MNKIIFAGVIVLLLFTDVFGQSGISDKEVPQKIKKAFNTKYPDAVEPIWYPYPNIRNSNNQQKVTPIFYPIGWRGDSPDYYEVRFKSENNYLRVVYNLSGIAQIISRRLDKSEIPSEVNVQLKDKGYADWKVVALEKITKRGESGKYFKIWLKSEGKKRILYFDESFKLVNTLKFDNDLNFVVNENARFKTAPKSVRQKSISSAEVPEKIKTKFTAKFKDIEIIEWYSNQTYYDPFAASGDPAFYNISAPAYYQIIFTQKGKKYIATYGVDGVLQELGEIIGIKKLPQGIKDAMKKNYPNWTLAKVFDKVEVEEGSFLYKVYGINNNQMDMLIMDEGGEVYNF